MKIMIYAIYDSKTEVYSQPNFFINRGAALRAWQDTANYPESNVSKHPADYTFFEIGEWDDNKGEIRMHQAKVNLGCAVEFIRRAPETAPYGNEKQQVNNN